MALCMAASTSARVAPAAGSRGPLRSAVAPAAAPVRFPAARRGSVAMRASAGGQSLEPDTTTKAIGAAYVVGVLAMVDISYWQGNEGAFIDFLQFVTKTLLGGHLICAFIAAVRSEASPGAGTNLQDNAVRGALQGALFGPLYIIKGNEYEAEKKAQQ